MFRDGSPGGGFPPTRNIDAAQGGIGSREKRATDVVPQGHKPEVPGKGGSHVYEVGDSGHTLYVVSRSETRIKLRLGLV